MRYEKNKSLEHTSIVQRLFGCVMDKRSHCCNCGNTYLLADPEWTIHLPLKPTLEECFDSWLAPGSLVGDRQYDCDGYIFQFFKELLRNISNFIF